MAAPQPRHLWNPNEACRLVIPKLAANSGNELLNSMEDYCLNTWAAIGPVYFPDHDPTNSGQPPYLVIRQAYRTLRLQMPEAKRPHVLVIKSLTLGNVLPPAIQERDIIWIVCKAPDDDVTHRWKDLLNEASVRLHDAHPNRRIFLILTTGLNWMPFLWDPPNQTAGMTPLTPNAPRLVFLTHENQVPNEQDWLRDNHIAPIPQDTLPGQNHVGGQVVPNGRFGAGRLPIDTTQAYSINLWDDAGNMTNLEQLALLENLLLLVRGNQFTDLNPPAV